MYRGIHRCTAGEQRAPTVLPDALFLCRRPTDKKKHQTNNITRHTDTHFHIRLAPHSIMTEIHAERMRLDKCGWAQIGIYYYGLTAGKTTKRPGFPNIGF